MGQLKRLIEDQRIDFDDHTRGNRTTTGWGTGIHMHKRFIDGRREGIEVIIPLDSDQKITIRNSRGNKDLGPIIREVRKALAPGQTRRDLVETISKKLDHLSIGTASLEEARATGQRIARHFDLDKNITEEIARSYKQRLTFYASIHRGLDDKKLYEIVQRPNRITLRPAQKVFSLSTKGK